MSQAPPPEPERFGHTPFICGYLGSDRAGLWPSLLALSPTPVKVRTQGRRHLFAASRAPGLERIRGRDPKRPAWTWGRHVVSRRMPATWREAAHDIPLAGFWVEGDHARLHVDGLGFVEVYWREVEGTTYFANRVDPLARLGGRLHTDWLAWSQQYFLRGAVHDRTAFAEVRRLAFGQSLVLQGRRVTVSRELAGFLQNDRMDGSVDELVGALEAQVPDPGDDLATAIGLSGGFDSRLIVAMMAARGARLPVAWTTHKDVDDRADLVFAAGVAAELGLEHHVLDLVGPAYWSRFREPTLQRFEHECVLHTWLAPLSTKVRRLGVPVWDGLHGDVLFRATGFDRTLAAGPLAAQRERQWMRQAGDPYERADAMRWDLRREFFDRARASYLGGTEVLQGHVSELVMRGIVTRGARVVGYSSSRLMAPEVPILVPFGSPEVLLAAGSIPIREKLTEDWYRTLIARFHPALAALPSTNDGLGRRESGQLPGQRRPRVVRALAAQICSDPVTLSVFHPAAQDVLRSGERVLGSGVSLEMLHWGSTLASWRGRYADVLADETI